jgi:LysR family transcriptional regulator, glycine cleavage system transcriptional activator
MTNTFVMTESGSSIRPPRALPTLASLRAFEAAAAHLSVQRAAAELHVTPTAVTHQIRGLEEELGVALFVRKPRQLALTAAGLRLFESLRQGLDTIATGVHAARQGQAAQVVTLTTTTAVVARWVMPRLGVFQRAHPGIHLRLHAGDAVVDLARGDADLAIRFGDGNWPRLATQLLGEERYAPMCSPSLGLRRVQDLERHPLIHFDWGVNAKAPAHWPEWARAAGLPKPARWVAARTTLSFSDEAQAMSATLAGLGVGLLSLTLTQAERDDGFLVQPFGPALVTAQYHLAAARGRENAPGVREVWNWIAAEFAN